ncbi:MAG: hypothetical protein WAW17_31165 [Rhodococcus sp. (in: high G+C Gram-positive bacteria)]|uniref:hypothetical protein n=1 Tax=Rhodococcus sp. TaxID=1831 RepID=UPI003BB09902
MDERWKIPENPWSREGEEEFVSHQTVVRRGCSAMVFYIDETVLLDEKPQTPQERALPRPSSTPPVWALQPQKSKRDRRSTRRVR